MNLPHELKEIPYRNRHHFALVNNVDGIFPGQIVRHKRTKKLLGSVGKIKGDQISIGHVCPDWHNAWYSTDDLEPAFPGECCGLWTWHQDEPKLNKGDISFHSWMVNQIVGEN